jgi:polyhydroxybutyrate depolymerase
MAENDHQRSVFVTPVRHICHCPQLEIFLTPNHSQLVATTVRRRFARFDDDDQKNSPFRAIREIARKITQLLGAVGLLASAMACGPSVVDLGAQGGGIADSGSEASAAMSGAGGAGVSGVGGGGGSFGLGRAGNGGAGTGAAAVGGADSGPPIANDAGPAVPGDAAVPGSGPDPSTGCGMPPPPTSDGSIAVPGSISNYVVALAAGYDQNKPYPLVMSFRGANVSIAAFRRTLDLPASVGADGIVVYLDCANGAGMWDLQRDPQVFDALLAKLEASYCVDRKRVFVVGHETGAIFANVLACTRGGVLRGLGSISGVMPQGTCTGPLAVWISQGNADMTLALGKASRAFWIQQNQCSATLSTPVDPSPCLESVGCASGSPVRYCEYDGNQDVPSFAASAVWNFFKGL